MTIGSHDWNGLALANGRYLITTKLGEGGMGFVYRALDRNIDAEVVIKVPRSAMMEDPEFAGRFTREIRSLVRLSHPHIVKVTDVGTWEGIPFAVMQFLSGGSLEDIRPIGPGRQPLPCNPEKVTRWLAAVAEALDYVHAQGYVHRDVKPGNILFDAHGHSFLSDFGVAKVLSSSTDVFASQTGMTGAGMVVGTAEYMAPELIMGEPFDGRVDQYALAVTAYELLCGRRPFEDETKTRVLVLHSTKSPPRLTDWCPALPEWVSQAVLKGLAKDPDERHPTCAALVAAIAKPASGTVARDDRVRIQCPACGKVGSLSAAEYTRLKESGRRLGCSACKTPLELPTAGPAYVAPATGAGGTTAISRPRHSDNFTPTRGPGSDAGKTTALSARGGSEKHVPPHLPETQPSATMALSKPTAPGREEPDGESRPAPARRRSRTIIERPPSPPDQKPTATFLETASISEIERIVSPTRDEDHAEGATPVAISGRTKTWVAFVAGALGSLLLMSLVFWSMVSRKETMTAAPQPAPPAPAVGSTVAGSTQTPAPPPPDRLEVSPSTAAHTTDELTNSTSVDRAPDSLPPSTVEEGPNPRGPSIPLGRLSMRRTPANLDAPRPSPPAPPSPGNVADVNERVTAAPRTIAFDPALLDRPKKAGGPKITLKKLLDESRAHANQIIVPVGMFYLEPSPADRPDGPRKYVVSEQQVTSRGPQGLRMSSSFSIDLVVEPRMARFLDDLNSRQRHQRPAILTVWVTGAGQCVLVKAEILQMTSNRIHGRFRADINYLTLVVEPSGATPGIKGVDTDWEQLERLLLLKNDYKKRIELLKTQLVNAELALVNSQMNAIFQTSMQSVLSQQAAQQSLQRQLMPR